MQTEYRPRRKMEGLPRQFMPILFQLFGLVFLCGLVGGDQFRCPLFSPQLYCPPADQPLYTHCCSGGCCMGRGEHTCDDSGDAGRYCPQPNDSADKTVCCTVTVNGISQPGCCSLFLGLATWAIVLIVVGVVVLIALCVTCCCCCCGVCARSGGDKTVLITGNSRIYT